MLRMEDEKLTEPAGALLPVGETNSYTLKSTKQFT
jgi:hypothetical protein